MRALLLDDARAPDWDALVAREGSFALTQSREWAAFKERLGWRAHRVAVEDGGELVAGAQLLVKRLPVGLSLAYVPRGPLGEWLDGPAGPLLLSELERLARAERAIFLKLEPPVPAGPRLFALLSGRDYRSSRLTNQPRTTMVLDIAGRPEEVLGRMHKKTRQYVRRAEEREGITVRLAAESDLPAFSELMHATSRREGFAPRCLEYYRAEWEAFAPGDSCALLLAYQDRRLIAARTVYRCGRHAAEFHGGSVTLRGLHPNHLLVWRAVQWARERGCTTYDLWGIPDEVEPAAADRPAGDDGRRQGPERNAGQAPERTDGLWGVYRFKRGFGAGVVRYAGAYDLVLQRHWFRLADAALVSRGVWERLAAGLDRAGCKTAATGVPS